MAIYKNNNGTWYVMIRYQDWTGARKQKCKRGFATRKEAADWELQFKLQKKASLDMTMESFCALYEEDVRPSLKQSTWLTKENIIQKKILPYLGQRKVSEITAKDVMDWHNQIAKENNCYKMMLLTGSKEESTLNFYRNAGYNSTDKTAFIQWIDM